MASSRRGSFWALAVGLWALLPPSARGLEAEALPEGDSATTTAVAPAPTPPPFTGMFYTATQFHAAGNVDAWNLARVGWRATDGLTLSYSQVFLNDYRVEGASGLNLRLDDAYFMGKWGEIFGVESLGLKVGLESRLMLPVAAGHRARGFILGSWTRLIARFTLSPQWSLTVEEAPIVNLHRIQGTGGSAPRANEVFRNFASITPTWKTSDGKLSLYVPIYWMSSRFRTFAEDPSRSGTWRHLLFLWPGATYDVSDTLSLGVNLLTGSLLTADLSGFDLGQALQQSVAAFEVTVTL